MCGIVGILGQNSAAPRLVESLRRLEYRGYDSAGIATLEHDGIVRVRAPGKLASLETALEPVRLTGTSGIGHTRWATHGAPNETNAHPHVAPGVAIVHNGIIENFRELKAELTGLGCEFESQTDTEIVAHLISEGLKDGRDPRHAVHAALKRLEGAFALAIMIEGYPDLLIGARKGSPLAVGHGENENYLGSDAIALAVMTNKVTYLEEGDWVVLSRQSVEIYDADGDPVDRTMQHTNASALLVDKGNHRHFMAKEIAEQPEVIGHTLAEYIDLAEGKVDLPDFPFGFENLERITITACGTAYYAGLAAKYWFERVARIPADVDIASEFRYREAPMVPGGLSIFVSQSGETADTLAALRYCQANHQNTLGIVNVRESTIARECEAIMPTFAGPEIGVASTKAFTCQLAVLACLAIGIARAKGTLSSTEETELVDALIGVPRHVAEILKEERHIEEIARTVAGSRDVLYLGRGISFPLALEGALKLKEISYIHAEGYAAGELKHGPIALIDESVPVIVIAPHDDLFDKTMSNMQEVAARGGKIILITDKQTAEKNGSTEFAQISVPVTNPFVNPMIYAVPVQLLAYHAAVFMGTDVDQPRNLAKSVTVE